MFVLGSPSAGNLRSPSVDTPRRLVAIVARERDLNSRFHGTETIAWVGIPGTGRLVRALYVDGAEVVKDDFPNTKLQDANRAADRSGSTIVRIPLLVGAVIVFMTWSTDGGRPSRTAVVLPVEGGEMTKDGLAVKASKLPGPWITPTIQRKGDQWVTVVNGQEWE